MLELIEAQQALTSSQSGCSIWELQTVTEIHRRIPLSLEILGELYVCFWKTSKLTKKPDVM